LIEIADCLITGPLGGFARLITCPSGAFTRHSASFARLIIGHSGTFERLPNAPCRPLLIAVWRRLPAAATAPSEDGEQSAGSHHKNTNEQYSSVSMVHGILRKLLLEKAESVSLKRARQLASEQARQAEGHVR
jgi:hypothetical protein